MVRLNVRDRDGVERQIDALPDGCPLMEVLRDADTGVEGICGGMCSCGTCHVYVDEAWRDSLPDQGEDEVMMLEAVGELVALRPGSRLACQIPIEEKLNGMRLEIAPAA